MPSTTPKPILPTIIDLCGGYHTIMGVLEGHDGQDEISGLSVADQQLISHHIMAIESILAGYRAGGDVDPPKNTPEVWDSFLYRAGVFVDEWNGGQLPLVSDLTVRLQWCMIRIEQIESS